MSKKVYLNKYLASAKKNSYPEIIKKNNVHECTKCNMTFNRFYNAKRHYDRFHTNSVSKLCCGKLFPTKGDYYNHRETVHKEIKRYSKNCRNEPPRLDNNNGNVGSHNMDVETILRDHTNGSSNDGNFDAQATVTARRRGRLRKDKCPKKLSKHLNTCDQNKISKCSEMQNIQRNKENIQRYVCKSESEVMTALTSITF